MDAISYPLPNMNSIVLAGKLGKSLGLVYRKDGRPLLKFTVITKDVNEKLGKSFTVAIPCELTGDRAERLAEELEVGDRVVVSGRLAYRTTGDQASSSLGVYAHSVQSFEARRLPGAA